MVAPGTRNPPDVVTTEIAPRAGPVPHYFPLFYRESTNIQVFSITVLTRFCRGDRNGWLRKKLDLLRSAFATFFFDRFFFRPTKKFSDNFFSVNFFFDRKFFFGRKCFSSRKKNRNFFFPADFFSSPKKNFDQFFFFGLEKKIRLIFFSTFFFNRNFFESEKKPTNLFSTDLKNRSIIFSTNFFFDPKIQESIKQQ